MRLKWCVTGQPVLIAGDLNADPAIIPCLPKAISEGRFVDLALAYSLGEGRGLRLPASSSWFSGLAILLELVETTGAWPQRLVDAYIAMILKTDGDSTPLGQLPLSVLQVVYRLWASLRLGHLREWVDGWLPSIGIQSW